jgi:hypothetical protein
VTADPGDVSFVWQFNNSGESFEVEQSRFGTSNGSTSDLYYTPKSERDYGTLACWGRNAIGRQAEPCVFQLVPAGNKLESQGTTAFYPSRLLHGRGKYHSSVKKNSKWKKFKTGIITV